ncbi:hypothetical protein ABC855_g1032 [[Candida] zeylanoides]
MSKKSTRDPPVKKNAFVHKLYSMLSDAKLSHLIWWTAAAEQNTFALFPGKEFAHALTGYFKHGNVASFVRQLHMYGFHKVSDPAPHAPHAGGADETPPVWEFKHSSGKFKKDDEHSLVYIKRRSSSNSSRSNGYDDSASPHPYDAAYPPHPHHPHTLGPPPPHLHPQHPPHVPQHLPPPPYPHDQYPVYYSQPPQYPYYQPPMMPVYPMYPYGYEGRDEHASQQQPPPQQPPPPQQAPPPPLVPPPPHSAPAAQTPQFRKIWDQGRSDHRQRHPSLLFDPLGPVSVPRPPSAGPGAGPGDSTSQSGALAAPRASPAGPAPLAAPMPRAPGAAPAGAAGGPRLPSPSSIHRASSSASGARAASTGVPASAAVAVSPRVASSMPRAPTSPSFLKPPSLSLQDRLRPSLIELHLGKNRADLSAADSIGSQSSGASVFSQKSSLSSNSSFQRQSSFGSISYHVHKKDSVVGPHDALPHIDQLPPLRRAGSPEQSGPHGPRTAFPARLRSLTSSPLSRAVEKEESESALSKISEASTPSSSSTQVPTMASVVPHRRKVSMTQLLSDQPHKTSIGALINEEPAPKRHKSE